MPFQYLSLYLKSVDEPLFSHQTPLSLTPPYALLSGLHVLGSTP